MKTNIFHVALTLSIFAGGILMAGWCVSSCWNWACREAFTDQNDITLDDRVREAASDPTWVTKGVRVIAPVVEPVGANGVRPSRPPRPTRARRR